MRELGERILLAAFEGWSDASEVATAALERIRAAGTYERVFSVDPEAYFDYQYTRPTVAFDDDGERTLTWPETTLWRPVDPADDVELWLLIGIEPARAWQSFIAEIVDSALAHDISGIVTVGAVMSDAPHSRDLPVSRTSEDAALRAASDVERSQYEGPAGILTVLGDAMSRAEMPALSMWVNVPAYGGAVTPSPKAVLALIDALDTIRSTGVLRNELATASARWEAALDAVVAADEDLVEYVSELERLKDEWDSPDASGEALAREFQRYLRRDGDGPRRP